MRMTFLRLGLGAILVIGCVANLPAQVAGRGSLNGLVTDSTGAAVRAASVALTDVATGVGLKSKTSASGLYSFVSLAPGSYRLEVSQNGFQTAVQNQITISVDQAATIKLALKPGAQTETVTVSAAQDIMDATSSTTAQLIGTEVIDRIPLLP